MQTTFRQTLTLSGYAGSWHGVQLRECAAEGLTCRLNWHNRRYAGTLRQNSDCLQEPSPSRDGILPFGEGVDEAVEKV